MSLTLDKMKEVMSSYRFAYSEDPDRQGTLFLKPSPNLPIRMVA
jgi:hypothetical protein